ncbi:hypothetical protein SteCoe_10032 [Stentor coeruleus]|uniref:2Fe-2S ferredoxin-type domain-containing protein n=1 Tax=Stentor coeruleus TaxID=5963 RepID=A0A1R2CGI9_9CILI|nr:hypothetical protein SteCoe_10032 [Stentor coeruleus]
MSKIRIMFQIGNGFIEAQARCGSRLANTIKKEGLGSSEFSKCNYKLECGKCIVSSSENILGCPSKDEEILLTLKGMTNNYRCSCQVIVTPDMQDKIIILH